MTRWIARALGVLLLLIFFMMLANLQRRLVQMQEQRGRRPAATAPR